MIGTLENARLLVTSTDRELDNMGWRMLGEGADKRAWLAPDNIVYKRIHDGGSCDANDLEWENYERLNEMGLPEGCFLPETEPYYIAGETIIAQEYITGAILSGFLSDIIAGFQWTYSLFDIGYDNVIVNNGRYFLIDLTS